MPQANANPKLLWIGGEVPIIGFYGVRNSLQPQNMSLHMATVYPAADVVVSFFRITTVCPM